MLELKEEKITWRSFFAGSTRGPIPTRWNVSGWPTIYIIDAKGVIRAKNLRGEPLEAKLDELVAEAEAESASPIADPTKTESAK